MNELLTIKSELQATEARAKKLADENPSNPVAQALRARVLAALEICDHVKFDDQPADEAPAGNNPPAA